MYTGSSTVEQPCKFCRAVYLISSNDALTSSSIVSFRAHILNVYESKDEWTQEEWLTVVLWASYCYRQVNRVESFKDGFPDINDLSKFFRSMGKIRKDAANGDGVSFFASAHQTTNFRTYEASLKKVAKDNGALLKSVVKQISETEDMWEMQQAAETLPG
jgi:hypothetical protein